MRHQRVFLQLPLAFLCINGPVWGQQIEVRLASIVPRDSNWHHILSEMGRQWEEASAGKVRVRIIAGVQRDEPELIRQLRIGLIHSAAVSTVGLGSIDQATQALHIPLAFASQEEMNYVLDRLAPRLELILEGKGYIVLNWVEVGWVYFFTKRPVARPDDLRRLKLFVWNTDAKAPELWKAAGFHPIPLAPTDILPSLQTGMIDAVTAPPVFHLANQWFALTPYMTDMPWAPLSGATIISKSTWEKIPPEVRPRLKEIARETGKQLRGEIRRMEEEAIRIMAQRGLEVVRVPTEARQEWQRLVEAQYPLIRRELIPAEDFDEVIRLRNEYRAKFDSAGNSGQ